MSDEKIVIFPRWKHNLKNEIEQDVKALHFSDALEKIETLLQYGIYDHNIMVARIVSLLELGQEDEAESFCLYCLSLENADYFHFVHIYITILYQTEQYESLTQYIDEEVYMDSMPEELIASIDYIYKASKDILVEEQREQSIVDRAMLSNALDGHDHINQWLAIESLRKKGVKPDIDISSLLSSEEIHPVVKTSLFEWLQELGHVEYVKIKKLESELDCIPTNIKPRLSQRFLKDTLKLLEPVQDDNPTLFKFMDAMLNRYVYVNYPLLPPLKDTFKYAMAIKRIGRQTLEGNNGEDRELEPIINAIYLSEKLYLSIIEDT